MGYYLANDAYVYDTPTSEVTGHSATYESENNYIVPILFSLAIIVLVIILSFLLKNDKNKK